MSATPQGVVFHDDALVVFNKPAGLPAVPGRTPELQDCAVTRLLDHWPSLRVVHRLDMPTSGLLLFALGLDMQRRLSQAFEQRQVAKHYEAVVQGLVEADAGEINLPLAADWPQRPRQRVCHEHGKAALTRWSVLARHSAPGTTRLRLEPITGRTHQLRVHLQAVGHPIVGDALYGPPQAAASRMLLHACQLALQHPVSERPICFQSPAPF